MRGETGIIHRIITLKDFNPLPSCEGRHRGQELSVCKHRFQSTPHARRHAIHQCLPSAQDFNPLPHARGDLPQKQIASVVVISIHSPHARRLLTAGSGRAVYEFQSTPLMRGETRQKLGYYNTSAISIHSPHARGDPLIVLNAAVHPYFNPLPSCEGDYSTL